MSWPWLSSSSWSIIFTVLQSNVTFRRYFNRFFSSRFCLCTIKLCLGIYRTITPLLYFFMLSTLTSLSVVHGHTVIISPLSSLSWTTSATVIFLVWFLLRSYDILFSLCCSLLYHVHSTLDGGGMWKALLIWPKNFRRPGSCQWHVLLDYWRVLLR